MPNTLKKNRLFLGALLMLNPSQAVWAVEDCDYATDLLFQAYHLYRQGDDVAQQKLLFNNSLQLCPNQPEVHNTLASILKKQSKYSEAVHHYKQALQLRPTFSEAWKGLGDTYRKQERFPLSLEAHSQACQTDKDSKAQIIMLLEDKSYTITNKSKVIDKESLLVLYSMERRQALNQRLFNCGLRDVVKTTDKVQPVHIFSNIRFDRSKTTLPVGTEQQLDEIAAALRQAHSSQIIKIHGHADVQPFSHISVDESDRRNWQLSQDRADVIATALAQRGVPEEHMKTYAHSYKQPLVRGMSPSALAKNRRVEIEVTPVVTKKSADEY